MSEPHTNPESRFVQTLKVLLFIGAFGILHAFAPLGTHFAFWGFAGGAITAGFAAAWASQARLRVWVVLAIGALSLLIGVLGSSLLRESEAIATTLGVAWTLRVSDLLLFGIGGGGLLFITRTLSKRWRAVALLELLVVVFLASYVLFTHRDYHINRPFWFADQIFRLGLYPPDVFAALGVGLLLVAVLMTLQQPSKTKLLLSVLVLLLIGGLGYWLTRQMGGIVKTEAPSAALLNQGDSDADSEEDSDGGGGGSGGGSGGKDGKSNSNNNQKQPPPEPVALVTFHDEPDLVDPIFYFRQNVQSRFDGTHLTVDSARTFDTDVLTTFPTDSELTSEGRDLAFYKALPNSMYLKVSHPQPISLGHASALRPLENPNPAVFTAAYEVTSQMLINDWSRFIGSASIPADWSPEKRAYYTAHPDDPRYAALAEELMRYLDPRFQDEDIAKALVIKAYLEKEGFYTRKETHSGDEPTASFLFGSLRGYCVHFAHAAVFLFRSQGIAARVAVGYAADAKQRGSGSSMMILGNQAHAWPEIHIEGVGWVTFDIYPERSDEPPPTQVDMDLSSMMGEIARKDPTGGLGPEGKLVIDWAGLAAKGLMGLGAILALLYLAKGVRQLLPSMVSSSKVHRWALKAANDRLADLNQIRTTGELREDYARRLAAQVPSLQTLVNTHYHAVLGGGEPAQTAPQARLALTQFRQEFAASVPLWKRALAWLNPIGWLRSR